MDILDYINPFSDNFILKGVLDFLGSILDFLNPFSENFFGLKLLELLGDLLEFLFVPSEERLTAISNTVSSKFNFVETIKQTINALGNILNNMGNSPVVQTSEIQSKYYNGRLNIIDMSFYAPFKPYVDLVITGLVYIFFIWRLFVGLPSIINGASPISTLLRGGKNNDN